MNKTHEAFVNTFLVIVATLATFAVLEAAANIWLLHFANEKHFIRYASLQQLQDSDVSNRPRYTPHRYIGYYPTPNYIKGNDRHNALGYRGDEIESPKPPGQFRIVCLGGSTTYTSDVKDYRKSYPYLLEKYLNGQGYNNVTVINAGAGSWSSWESLINFQLRVLDIEPDLIIIYHSINDISPRFVWPPEAYRQGRGLQAHAVIAEKQGERPPPSSAALRDGVLSHERCETRTQPRQCHSPRRL